MAKQARLGIGVLLGCFRPLILAVRPWAWALCVVSVAAAPESVLAAWLLGRSAPPKPPPAGLDTLGIELPAFQIVVLIPDASDGMAWVPDAAVSWLAAPSAVRWRCRFRRGW